MSDLMFLLGENHKFFLLELFLFFETHFKYSIAYYCENNFINAYMLCEFIIILYFIQVQNLG